MRSESEKSNFTREFRVISGGERTLSIFLSQLILCPGSTTKDNMMTMQVLQPLFAFSILFVFDWISRYCFACIFCAPLPLSLSLSAAFALSIYLFSCLQFHFIITFCYCCFCRGWCLSRPLSRCREQAAHHSICMKNFFQLLCFVSSFGAAFCVRIHICQIRKKGEAKHRNKYGERKCNIHFVVNKGSGGGSSIHRQSGCELKMRRAPPHSHVQHSRNDTQNVFERISKWCAFGLGPPNANGWIRNQFADVRRVSSDEQKADTRYMPFAVCSLLGIGARRYATVAHTFFVRSNDFPCTFHIYYWILTVRASPVPCPFGMRVVKCATRAINVFHRKTAQTVSPHQWS